MMNLLLVVALLSGARCSAIWGPKQVSSAVNGTVTIRCGYQPEYKDKEKDWCVERLLFLCQPLAKTDGSVTDSSVSLSEDKSRGTLSITMRDLRQEDEGWYECRIQTTEVSIGYTASAVYLNIDRDASIPDLQGPENIIGQLTSETTIHCLYSKDYETHTKYWCQGARRRNCSIVVSTDSPQTRGRTSIRDDQTHREFTVTVSDLRAEDEGWYWCGIKRTFHFSDKLVPVFLTVNSGKDTLPSAFPY
ncbi:CLM1 protein, partial [Amia calva]|nr:CLM1 protein [Amia calva]